MTPEAWIILAAFLLVSAMFVNVACREMDQAEELREQDELIAALLAELDECDADKRHSYRVELEQARRSVAQKARIAELEKRLTVAQDRELSDAIRRAAAAHGSAWGPTL